MSAMPAHANVRDPIFVTSARNQDHPAVFDNERLILSARRQSIYSSSHMLAAPSHARRTGGGNVMQAGSNTHDMRQERVGDNLVLGHTNDSCKSVVAQGEIRCTTLTRAATVIWSAGRAQTKPRDCRGGDLSLALGRRNNRFLFFRLGRLLVPGFDFRLLSFRSDRVSKVGKILHLIPFSVLSGLEHNKRVAIQS